MFKRSLYVKVWRQGEASKSGENRLFDTHNPIHSYGKIFAVFGVYRRHGNTFDGEK